MKKGFVGFFEDLVIIKSIDQAAKLHGLNRSGYIRLLIREKLGRTTEE